MNSGIAVQNRSTLTFFVRVFALSTPFFWIGSVTELQPMPRFCGANLASLALRLRRRNHTVCGKRRRLTKRR